MSISNVEKFEKVVSDDQELEKGGTASTEIPTPCGCSEDETNVADVSDAYITGKRFYLLFIGLDMATFLVQLEMTIVATALLAIANDLKDFKHSTWIVNAYFLTWSAFMVIWSQLSVTIGRKKSFLMALGLFIIASAACAAAQTSIQLYGFRSVQGLAGGGVFNLCYSISCEAVPLSTLLNVLRVLAALSMVSAAAGPLIGGVIASKTTWRWIFILNIPLATIAFLIVLLTLPNGFPYHQKPVSEQPRLRFSSLKHFDIIGALLFLVIIFLSVVPLQEVAATFSWNSAITICLLTLSGTSAIIFVFWERFVTRSKASITPILTYRFATRRILAMFANSALVGVPFLFALVQIPQRFQLLDGFSPLHAAIALLPFIAVISVGAILGSVLGRKYLGTPIYGQFLGAVLQLVATICFTVSPLQVSSSGHVPSSQYGFQVLLGLGSGISYITNVTGLQHILGRQPDLMFAGSGAIMQFRYVGAAIGLAALTAAFNTYVRSSLSPFLDSEQTSAVLQSSHMILSLSVGDQARVLGVFAQAFDLQWKILCGAVGLQIITASLTY